MQTLAPKHGEIGEGWGIEAVSARAVACPQQFFFDLGLQKSLKRRRSPLRDEDHPGDHEPGPDEARDADRMLGKTE